jgi:Tol biopolymer transport system component
MRVTDARLTGRVLRSLCVAILSGCAGSIGGSATSMGSRWDIYAGGGEYVGTHPSIAPDGLSVVYSTPATGHGDIYRFDRTTGKNIRLTTDPDYDGYPLFSTDGNHILFEHETNGLAHLYVMDADGNGQRPLTDGPTFDFGASFSADGRRIAFCRDREGVCHVWAMNVDGSNPRQLTDGPWFDCSPSFSPDGGRIVFKRRERGQIHLTPARDKDALSRRFDEVYVMNADGTNLRQLTNNSTDDAPIGFSRDGTRIFFCTLWRMGVMDSDGENADDLGDGFYPALSLDGRKIVFATGRDQDIGLMNSDGTGRRTIYRSRVRTSDPAFTPDGAHLIFVEWPEQHGAGRIRTLDIETTKTEPVSEIK